MGVSASGSMVYARGPASPSSAPTKLVMIDRAGKLDELKVPPAFYERPRVSPDGSQVALGSDDPAGANIWIYDLSGKSSIRQLTFDAKNRFPVWSHDGSHVAFQSDRQGDLAIFWQRSDGNATAERLTKPEKNAIHIPETWSRDGRHLWYTVSAGGTNELWVYSAETRKSAPFGDVRSPRLLSPSFSADGRWVAYTATSGEQNQVVVQPFPATGAKYLVGSGARPQWSPDGKEIFYYRTQGTFVKTVTTQPRFTLSNEATLPFNVYMGRGPGSGRDADIMPDGRRWVAVLSSAEPNAGPSGIREFQVVLNWFEELKQRVRP
jgi:serine/threonine-protein kinase